jgi:hypothetical protein
MAITAESIKNTGKLITAIGIEVIKHSPSVLKDRETSQRKSQVWQEVYTLSATIFGGKEEAEEKSGERG